MSNPSSQATAASGTTTTPAASSTSTNPAASGEPPALPPSTNQAATAVAVSTENNDEETAEQPKLIPVIQENQKKKWRRLSTDEVKEREDRAKKQQEANPLLSFRDTASREQLNAAELNTKTVFIDWDKHKNNWGLVLGDEPKSDRAPVLEIEGTNDYIFTNERDNEIAVDIQKKTLVESRLAKRDLKVTKKQRIGQGALLSGQIEIKYYELMADHENLIQDKYIDRIETAYQKLFRGFLISHGHNLILVRILYRFALIRLGIGEHNQFDYNESQAAVKAAAEELITWMPASYPAWTHDEGHGFPILALYILNEHLKNRKLTPIILEKHNNTESELQQLASNSHKYGNDKDDTVFQLESRDEVINELQQIIKEYDEAEPKFPKTLFNLKEAIEQRAKKVAEKKEEDLLSKEIKKAEEEEKQRKKAAKRKSTGPYNSTRSKRGAK